MKKIDIDKLEREYYEECTVNNNDHIRFNKFPDELFKWFKEKITQQTQLF